MRQFWFMVVKGTNEGRRLDLEHGITLLGRLEEATAQDPPGSRRWTIHDPTVSRTHCAITWTQGKAPVITHLSATNDTLVGGERIKEQELKGGDSVQIGLTQMIFKELIVEAPPAPAVVDAKAEALEQTEALEDPLEPTIEEPLEENFEDDPWSLGSISDWVPERTEAGWAPTVEPDDDDGDGWNPR